MLKKILVFVAAVIASCLIHLIQTQNIEENVVLPENSTFSVKFIDVGQADAALIECDGHYMLIDGGNKDDSRLMYSLLERQNISHLDIVVGSHAHEDHVGGLSGALNFAMTDLVLCPITEYDSVAFRDFKKYAIENGIAIIAESDVFVYKK